MTTPFDTVREALTLATDGPIVDRDGMMAQALKALATIETDHYSAADMADAQAKAFRAGVASVTAGHEPVAWLVCSVNSDDSLSLEHAAAWKEAAHEHINDAITEHGIEDAASWVVRPAYVAAPVAQQPQQCHKKANDYCKCPRKAMLCDGVGPAQQPQAEPKCECNATMDTFCEVCTEYRKWEQPQAEAVRSKPVRVCHIRDAACSEFAAKCGECPEASSEWWKHEQAQTLHLSSDEAPQQAEAAASNEYQRNILTSVSNWMRTRSHTAWAEKFGYSSLMRTWADDLQAVAAPQQAEAVTDVVRDAAPIPDHELVTMYDERPTSDLEMIEFAREVERRHGIGVQPQHITDGSPCWCNPDVAYTDPETGASVIVHRRPQ